MFPYLSQRFFHFAAVFIAIFMCSIAGHAEDVASKVDLTKPSSGVNNSNAFIVLNGVPTEETNTKNERYLTSPALVSGPVVKGVTRPDYRLTRWRHEMLGHKVEVEGLALGDAPQKPSQMTGQRVIYEGGMIFIKGVDFARHNAKGRLIRVSGVLRLHPESAMVFRGHEPITVEKYYYIDAQKLEVVKRVAESRLIAPQLHP